MCVTCIIDSVYVFNHRAILAEWFKGTDSNNDALVFGKLIHAGRCPAQTNITSHCVPVCRGGVHPYRGRDVGRSGGSEDTIHIIWSFGEAIAQKTPLPTPNISSTVLLPPCGGHPLNASPSSPPCPPPPPQWMVYCSVCVCVCII